MPRELVLPDGRVVGTIRDGVAPPTSLPDGSPLPKGTMLRDVRGSAPAPQPAKAQVPTTPIDIRSLTPGLMRNLEATPGGAMGQGERGVGVYGQPKTTAGHFVQDTVEALPIAMAVAAPYLAPAAGITTRALLSGLGFATGNQIVDATQPGSAEGFSQNAKEVLTDTAIGAASEVGPYAVGWALNTGGLVLKNAAKGFEFVERAGTNIVKGFADKQATNMYARLRQIIPPDAPLPAQRLFDVIERLKAGKWNNPITEEIRRNGGKEILKQLEQADNAGGTAYRVAHPSVSTNYPRKLPWWLSGEDNPKVVLTGEKKTPEMLKSDEAMRSHWQKRMGEIWDEFAAGKVISGRPANIGDEIVEGSEFGEYFRRKSAIDPWDQNQARSQLEPVQIPQEFRAKPPKGWEPHYFVFDDGVGVLAFREPNTGRWFDAQKKLATNPTGFINEESIAKVLSAKNKGANLVTSVPAEALPDGSFAMQLQGFKVERSPAMRFETLNDLMKSTSTMGEGFKNMGAPAKREFKALQGAVRATISESGPEAAKTLERALRWGRIKHSGITLAPGMAKNAARLGVLEAGQQNRDSLMDQFDMGGP